MEQSPHIVWAVFTRCDGRGLRARVSAPQASYSRDVRKALANGMSGAPERLLIPSGYPLVGGL